MACRSRYSSGDEGKIKREKKWRELKAKSTCKQNRLKGGEHSTGYDPVDAKNRSIEVQESNTND